MKIIIYKTLRLKAMPIIACLFLVGYTLAQTPVSSSVKPKKTISQIISLKKGAKPIVVVNGVIVKGDLDKIDVKSVVQIDVLKGKDAVNIYGKAAKDGAVLITTKQYAPQFNKKIEKVSDFSITLNDTVIDTNAVKKIDTESVAFVTALNSEGPYNHVLHARSKGVFIYTKDYVRQVNMAKLIKHSIDYDAYIKKSNEQLKYILDTKEINIENSQKLFELPDSAFKSVTLELPTGKNPATLKITTVPQN